MQRKLIFILSAMLLASVSPAMAGQIRNNDGVTGGFETRGDFIPAPRSVPRSVDQHIGTHGVLLAWGAAGDRVEKTHLRRSTRAR